MILHSADRVHFVQVSLQFVRLVINSCYLYVGSMWLMFVCVVGDIHVVCDF